MLITGCLKDLQRWVVFRILISDLEKVPDNNENKSFVLNENSETI